MTANIYDELGLRPLINAAGTYTAIGGSRMSPATLEAIRQAASQHIEIRQLQKVVHAKLAELTRNEAAFVCNGAASGLYLATATAVARKLGKPAYYLEAEEIAQSEVIIFGAHRNPYDFAVKQFGAKIRQIGYPNIILPLTPLDLQQAINDRTAAVFFFAGEGGWMAPGGLSFEDTQNICSERAVPLIVDCAAQIPPIENLWRYTQAGADAAIFSGGKDLKGPQSSGLIVGIQEFVGAIQEVGFPNYGFGRMLKTGREEIIGLYHAVKEAVELNWDARNEWAEEQIRLLAAGLEGTCFSVSRCYPNEAGQPMARASVSFPHDEKKMLDLLLNGEPRIMCNSEHPNQVFVNPMTLREGEMALIIDRFRELDGEL
ncbi:hypothetical protein E1162_13230 [Rhodobacteraceae bacterium RKSG542]|uniref:hypothetical protein n=1 Tax=Pseudovibrio flavus TaxID=2529854 RepID=UPI0012BB80F8|nr:hypothetical protein [Pseudovibrio flavus]MTI18203.1 hypothetical protein [Pseudovibrio flavus]